MAVILLILTAMAILHFVYDGIIAPSQRMALRYEIFEQRDVVRKLCAQHPDDDDQNALESLHDTINTAICLVSTISVSMLFWLSWVYNSSRELQAKIQKRRRLLDRSRIAEVKEIRNATDNAVKRALWVNSFGLFLWLLPIVAFGVFLRRIVQTIQKVLLSPPHDLRKILPPDGSMVG